MPEPRPIRIGIDGRELAGAPTGVGRFLFEILDRWRRRDDAPGRQFVIYVPQDACRQGLVAEIEASPGLGVRALVGRGGTLWEQVRLPQAANGDRLDVFFSPAYSAPLVLTAPVVVAIHDLSFVARPEWFRWPGGLRRRALARWSARKAARVVTISRFSAGEIRRWLDVDESRLVVIPPGLSPPSRFGTTGSRPGREALVLYVGSIFNRRHVPDLVRAFARLARGRPDVRLVVAGENRSFPAEDPERLAAELGIADRVSVRAYVTDAELGELYRRAGAFAFLSEYEGFGLTPLEALAHGVPVVVGDTPAAREVLDGAAAFVEPDDIHAVAVSLERLLFDAAARRAQLERAPDVLARYSWDRTAAGVLEVLDSAAGRDDAR